MESIKQVSAIALCFIIISSSNVTLKPLFSFSNELLSSMGKKILIAEDSSQNTLGDTEGSNSCWKRSYAAIRKVEGGDSNHKNDRGGLTSRGLTYKAAGGDPTKLTDAQVKAIYKRDYWVASGADKLEWPLCLAVFNSYVNSGRKWSYDKKATVREQALEVLNKQRAYYLAIVKRDKSQKVFLRGWLNRDKTLRAIMDLPQP
jgi:lysozyme family protein